MHINCIKIRLQIDSILALYFFQRNRESNFWLIYQTTVPIKQIDICWNNKWDRSQKNLKKLRNSKLERFLQMNKNDVK